MEFLREDAKFTSAGVKAAYVGSDFVVHTAIQLPTFNGGVGGGHTDPRKLYESLLAAAVPHWAIVADSDGDSRMFDHRGAFSGVARRRAGRPPVIEGQRGGGLQDTFLSVAHAWELKQTIHRSGQPNTPHRGLLRPGYYH